MPIQDNVGTLVTYGIQSTLGTPATAAGTSQRLRRISSTLNLSKDAFASQEVRADQQVATLRHGGRRVDGGIDGELSTVSWDDFFAAGMRQTPASGWVSGASVTQAAHTSVALTGSVFTVGSGSLITAGFKVGDIVRFSNIPAPGAHCNNVNLRITALTATTMTVASIPAGGNFTAQTTFTLAVAGRKLAMGTAKPLFTVEHNYPDLDVSERFDDLRVGGFSVRMPPNGIATVQWQVMGRNAAVLTSANAPYFTSVTAAGATEALTGIEGGLRLGGVEQAIVTGLDFSVSLNLSATPVIGSNIVPDYFYGRIVATGSVSFYLENETLLNAFLNETELDLVAVALAAGSAPQDFLAFNFQRIKLMGAQKQIGPDGGIVVNSPFQAMLRTGGSGTAFDQTTMSIQRSNT